MAKGKSKRPKHDRRVSVPQTGRGEHDRYVRWTLHGFDPELRQASEPYTAPGRYHPVHIAATDPKELIRHSKH